jgi:RimJ/RimL family protein N-acetyltransferase
MLAPAEVGVGDWRREMTASTVLRGEFIDLRPLTVEDAEMTLRWRCSPRARKLKPGAKTLAEQERWIAARPPGEFNFIIQLKSGKPVGMISLVDVDTLHCRAEAGRLLIGEEEAARGVPAAVEALKLLYELAFDTLNLKRVFGTMAEENVAMYRWQVYLGMKEEGRLRRHYFIDGHFQDAVYLGILEEEYRRIALPRMRALLAAGRQATGQEANCPGIVEGEAK